MADHANSYLIFVHVSPIPEDQDAVTLEQAIAAAGEIFLPDYTVEITAAWISEFSVISLADLDRLPLST